MTKHKILRIIHFLFDSFDSAIAFICLAASIIISILGIFGISFTIDKNVFMILSLLPLITFMVFSRLRRIEKSMIDRSKYYNDSEDVIKELKKMCRRSNDFIYATGSRTKKELLQCLEEAISNPEIRYRRLTTSQTNITEDLKQHILRIEGLENCKVKHKEMPACPNFWVTESQVMIILPFYESGRFRGVQISDKNAVTQYVGYFDSLFLS